MRPFSLTKGTSQWHYTFSFHCIQAILKANKKSSLNVMIASVGREALSTHFLLIVDLQHKAHSDIHTIV